LISNWLNLPDRVIHFGALDSWTFVLQAFRLRMSNGQERADFVGYHLLYGGRSRLAAHDNFRAARSAEGVCAKLRSETDQMSLLSSSSPKGQAGIGVPAPAAPHPALR